MTLIPCEACARHVREAENRCPFCLAPREPTQTRGPTTVGRLGRAAMFAFGTTTIAALSTLTACGNATPPTTVTPPVPPPDTSIAAPYGAPPDPRPEPPPPPTTTADPPVPPEVESEAPHHHRSHLPEASVVALYGAPGLGSTR